MSSISAIDPDGAGDDLGKVIREIIRGEIGFDGLLISDDTSMKALSGDFPDKAAAILAAGVDIVLHCNGVMEEMAGIASRTTALAGKSLERAERALTYIEKRDAASPRRKSAPSSRAISRRWLSRGRQDDVAATGRAESRARPSPMDRLWAETDRIRAPPAIRRWWSTSPASKGRSTCCSHLARNQKVDLARISILALAEQYLDLHREGARDAARDSPPTIW